MKMEDVTNGESLFPNFDPTADLSKAPKSIPLSALIVALGSALRA